MKKKVPKQLEQARLRGGPPYGSDESFGWNGIFHLKVKTRTFRLMISDQEGWDHVSVSVIGKHNKKPSREPTWREMCMIKDLCFDPEEIVIQIHPPASQYVNVHQFVLHLWRSQTSDILMPPIQMV